MRPSSRADCGSARTLRSNFKWARKIKHATTTGFSLTAAAQWRGASGVSVGFSLTGRSMTAPVLLRDRWPLPVPTQPVRRGWCARQPATLSSRPAGPVYPSRTGATISSRTALPEPFTLIPALARSITRPAYAFCQPSCSSCRCAIGLLAYQRAGHLGPRYDRRAASCSAGQHPVARGLRWLSACRGNRPRHALDGDTRHQSAGCPPAYFRITTARFFGFPPIRSAAQCQRTYGHDS